MAIPVDMRVRSRVVPMKFHGTHKLGGFYSAITQGGVPTGRFSTVEINPRTFVYQAPYDWAEFSYDQIGHKGPPYYEGGPFKHLIAQYMSPYGGVFGSGTYVKIDLSQKYVGGFSPPPDYAFGGLDISTPNSFLTPNSTFFPNLDAYGQKAWRKTKPKIEYADAYVFLKEFKDTKRMVMSTGKLMLDSFDETLRRAINADAVRLGVSGKRLENFVFKRLNSASRTKMMTPRYASDQFLNGQFGWLPFLSDIWKFDSTIQNFIAINARISERNGKWRRRRVTVATGDDTIRVAGGNGCILDPVLGTHWSQYFLTEPTWETTQRTEFEVTSVGSFRYYLREFDMEKEFYNSEWARMMRQLDIFGARISPYNIYRAIPWTWANDWFNSASTYLEYLSDALMNDLVCKYFYVLGHWKVTTTFSQTLPFPTGTKVLQFSKVIETKQRLPGGSPFDYSLTWDGLSPRQLAILAALGITRH